MSGKGPGGAAAGQVDTAKLFGELEKALGAQHYERAVDVCESVLKAVPSDRDAALTKLVLLIKLARYDTALTFLTRQTALKLADVAFERAYALYRLGRLRDALDVLQAGISDGTGDSTGTERRLNVLLAQVHYKLEEYEAAEGILQTLAAQTDPASHEYQEILTNLHAAQAASGQVALAQKKVVAASGEGGGKGKGEGEGEEAASFEVSYNKSLCALVAGDLAGAESLVDAAEAACKATVDGEEELKDELAPILVQKAIIEQLKGKKEAALELYNTVIKSKPSDSAAVAIASNNAVSIKQEKDLFDAAKKLKQAESFIGKLSLRHRQIVDTNNVVLLMYMNKSQLCRDACNKLKQAHPTVSAGAIILAALAYREKKKSVVAALADLKATHTDASAATDAVVFCKAQLEASQGQFSDALASLLSLPDATTARPALASIIVKLFEKTERAADANKFLATALGMNPSDKNLLLIAARFKLKNGFASEATGLYEAAIKKDPQDIEAISGLIKIYAHSSNPAMAQKYESALPDLEASTTDGEALEALISQRHFRPRNLASASVEQLVGKSTAKGSTTTNAAATAAAAGGAKKNKGRKHKIRLPKHYTPGGFIDPERWLPKRERSSFRKTRKQRDRDREMSKGASQGAAPAPAAAAAAAAAAPTPSSSSSAAKQGADKSGKKKK